MNLILKEGNEIQAPNRDYPLRKFQLIKNIDKQNPNNNIYISKVTGWNNQQEVTLQFIESYKIEQRFIENLNFIQNNQQNSNTNEIFSSNIVQILESLPLWINCQQYFLIIMEKVETDLFQYIKECRVQLQQPEKLQICLDITQSIALIHQHSFLNRDIKPESFFRVKNRFKLANFLLMRKYNSKDPMMMTQNIGTKMYLSPERIQNKSQYTQKVDIWSLACVYYEIFYGKPLFDYPDIEIVNHIKNQKPVLDKIDNLYADKEFKKLMGNMLNPEDEKRLNCQQIIIRLEQIKKNVEKLDGCQIINNQYYQIDKSHNKRPNTLQPIAQTPEKQEINEISKNNKLQNLQTPQINNQKIESLEKQVIELSETVKQFMKIIQENEQDYSQKIRKLEQEVEVLKSQCIQQRNFTERQYAQGPSIKIQEVEPNLYIQIPKRQTNLSDDRQFNLEKLQQNQKQQSNQNQYNQNEFQKQTFQIKEQNQFQGIVRNCDDNKQEKEIIVEYINNDRKKPKL